MYIGAMTSQGSTVFTAALQKLIGTTKPVVPKIANDPNNLDEVVVTARPSVRTTAVPLDEPIQEITVEARRTPWYVWALGGAAAVAILNALRN